MRDEANYGFCNPEVRESLRPSTSHMSQNPFPIFLSLAESSVLIVGGGDMAVAKLRLLRPTGARIVVVAAAPSAEMIVAIKDAGAELRHRDFIASDLDAVRLCFVALDEVEATARIVGQARDRGILVNAVDRPALCDFTVPAVVDRSPVTIAISTGGAAPALARDLRRRIETIIPSAYGRLATICRRWRERVATAVPDPARRRRLWDSVLDDAEAMLAGTETEAEERISRALDAAIDAQASLLKGRVSLVGAGPGDPELLTLKALQAIQRADVILYDRLIDHAILDLARRGARRIDVGKRCANHVMSQAAINELLMTSAQSGEHVVRLKGGDPFIFGRGGEEIIALRQAGLTVEVIPGVTAACAAAARLGIPLTHRELSHGVHFLTGHGKDGGLAPHDWDAMASSAGTLAVYMGANTAPLLSARLIAAGMATDTPALAIENATMPDEHVVVGTLASLPVQMRDTGLGGPTLILIGAVVALRNPASNEDVTAIAGA